MKRYFQYIKPYWIFFIASPLLMIVEVYCDVKLPSLAATVINDAVANGSGFEIGMITGQMLFFVVLAILSGVGASYCATKASILCSSDIREAVFVKIQSFSFANIDRFSTASLITRLTNDTTQIQQLIVMCLRMLFRAPGILIGAIIMTYSINAQIGFIYLMLVPILSLVMGIILYISYGRFHILQEKIDALNANVREVLTNIRVIKGLTREEYEENQFRKVNNNLKNSSLSAYMMTILQTPLMTLIINVATIYIIWIGSAAYTNGTILIGDISAFITYLAQVLMSVGMLAMVFLQVSRALVSTQRISEVLDAEVDINDDHATNKDNEIKVGNILFENVDFKYYKNNHELVLSNINLEINAGETVGIIGSTGCGKTSLVHLIPRLYDVDQGAVYIDGINIKEYSLKNLRDSVAMVLQNNVLFSGSIKENIKWGDENASDEEVKLVTKWAAIDTFVDEQEMKYDSMLSQGGLNLSGGQKQRLCIARALLKKPKILILDDSTSAVDTYTESVINQHLNTDLKETTKIIIAQRVSSVINADKIVVMNDGKIEQMGMHDELLESCETYQQIYHSQMSKD
ncbi:MAG: ABC transporter ATP-binding protein [Erysipelotrichaceae bacterium]